MTKTWCEAIESWSLALRAAGRAESTITRRREHLRWCAAAVGVGPWEVTTGDLLAWTGSRQWATETRRSVRSSLRTFYSWAVLAGRLSTSPAAQLPPIRPTIPVPRPAPELVYRAALRDADDRERVMLRLAAEAGLRRAEVAAVHENDMFEDLGGWSLRVLGKGARVRVVPLTGSLARELRERLETVGGGWAFPGQDSGHLSPRWVGKLVGRLLPDDVTMHALRHRFATKAYAAAADLLAVQALLGHASPVTTRVYVQLPSERLRQVVTAAA